MSYNIYYLSYLFCVHSMQVFLSYFFPLIISSPLSSGRTDCKFMRKSFEFFETKSTFLHQLLVLSKFATNTHT